MIIDVAAVTSALPLIQTLGLRVFQTLVAAQLNPVAITRGSGKPTDIEEIFGTRLVDS